MASNSFGTLFRITTWGESHGKAIGVVIDGCPAGLEINESDISLELKKRAPGYKSYTSTRKEEDLPEILSGVFEGKTTGAPISIIIYNKDADSSKYEPIKNLLRPGHANFTYLEKYGIFDYKGGGRSSARETAARVAAGAVAQKLLKHFNIECQSRLSEIGDISHPTEDQVDHVISNARSKGDSLGGIVEFIATGVASGLGDPIYEKLEAKLASAMLSIPACKGFEIGSGFQGSRMSGSTHNDLFIRTQEQVKTKTNHAGGVLGGISTGMPIYGRVAFKPTSSIFNSQKTLTTSSQTADFNLPEGSRHDPCVAIRAVIVVKAMLCLVIADALLINRSSKL